MRCVTFRLVSLSQTDSDHQVLDARVSRQRSSVASNERPMHHGTIATRRMTLFQAFPLVDPHRSYTGALFTVRRN